MYFQYNLPQKQNGSEQKMQLSSKKKMDRTVINTDNNILPLLQPVKPVQSIFSPPNAIKNSVISEYRASPLKPIKRHPPPIKLQKGNQGSLGKLKTFLNKYQNSYISCLNCQSDSCTPTVDTTNATISKMSGFRREMEHENTTKEENIGTSESTKAQRSRYSSQTPELEVVRGILPVPKQLAKQESSQQNKTGNKSFHSNIARSNSQKHNLSFCHVPTIPLHRESSRVQAQHQNINANIVPSNRSLSTIRNLHPIQEYFSCETNSEIQGNLKLAEILKAQKGDERSKTISTSRRHCGAITSQALSKKKKVNVTTIMHSKEVTSMGLTKISEDGMAETNMEKMQPLLSHLQSSTPSQFSLITMTSLITAGTSVTQDAAISSRKPSMVQPSARITSEALKKIRQITSIRRSTKFTNRTGATPTPSHGDVTELPQLNVSRIKASPETAIQMRRRISISKSNLRKQKESEPNPISIQICQKQMSATNLFKGGKQVFPSNSTIMKETRRSLNHTTISSSEVIPKKQTKRGHNFNPDTIYEINEEELDISKIKQKCHMQQHENIVLVPTLKNPDAFFGGKFSIKWCEWLMFEPELQIFKNV